jgi:hypothetical protein
MGLAQTRLAVDKKWIIAAAGVAADLLGRRMGEAIAVGNDEVVEGMALVEGRGLEDLVDRGPAGGQGLGAGGDGRAPSTTCICRSTGMCATSCRQALMIG